MGKYLTTRNIIIFGLGFAVGFFWDTIQEKLIGLQEKI